MITTTSGLTANAADDDERNDAGIQASGSDEVAPTVVQIAAWRAKHQVGLSADCPAPLITFAACQDLVPGALISSMRAAGFAAPSPIQAAAWPAVGSGRDVIGIASTGSGKTLAFLAPAFARVAAGAASSLVLPVATALVLAPTRELACQIDKECERFGGRLGLESACLYGGAPKDPQLAKFEAGVHIIIATPGRLNDFLQTGHVRLDEVTYVVLDEADRMLDLGFEPQIRDILHIVGRRRQTLLFSATWPQSVRALAAELLVGGGAPCHVTIGTGGERLTASRDVRQSIEFFVRESDREAAALRHLRRQPEGARVLVFCSSKKAVDALARTLHRERIACTVMHGDRDQIERERALKAFRDGEVSVLVATDVAARGLDIKGVELVLNFEFPTRTEDYIHRIGRTGRAGSKGAAVTFMSSADAPHAPALLKILKESGVAKAEIPKELRQMAKLMKPPSTSSAVGSSSSSTSGQLPSSLYGP